MQNMESILGLDRLNNIEKSFEMVQILNQDGEVVNDAIDIDLTDEQLLELMKRMIFAREFD